MSLNGRHVHAERARRGGSCLNLRRRATDLKRSDTTGANHRSRRRRTTVRDAAAKTRRSKRASAFRSAFSGKGRCRRARPTSIRASNSTSCRRSSRRPAAPSIPLGSSTASSCCRISRGTIPQSRTKFCIGGSANNGRSAAAIGNSSLRAWTPIRQSSSTCRRTSAKPMTPLQYPAKVKKLTGACKAWNAEQSPALWQSGRAALGKFYEESLVLRAQWNS